MNWRGRARLPSMLPLTWSENVVEVYDEDQLRAAITKACGGDGPMVVAVRPIYTVNGTLVIDDYIGDVRIACVGAGLIATRESYPLFKVGDRRQKSIETRLAQVRFDDCILIGGANVDVIQGAATLYNDRAPKVYVDRCVITTQSGGDAIGGDFGDLYVNRSQVLRNITIDSANTVDVSENFSVQNVDVEADSAPGSTDFTMIGNKDCGALKLRDGGGDFDFSVKSNHNMSGVDIDLGAGSVVANNGSGTMDATGTSAGLMDANRGWGTYTNGGLTAGTNVA